MKSFKITVNGNVYHVEVEEITGNGASITAKTPELPPPQQPREQAPKPAAPAPVKKEAPAGAQKITAPLPGTVMKINVKEGEIIAKNQAVCVIEAMKMENEITSPFAGRVATLNASSGQTVATGDVIMTVIAES